MSTVNINKLTIPGKTIVEYIRLNAETLTIGNDQHTRVRYTPNRYADDILDLYNMIEQLDENYEKIDYVPGLKTSLYPHQQTAVRAMLTLESTRQIPIDLHTTVPESRPATNRKNTTHTTSKAEIIPRILSYNAAVLSEPVGSGKTIDLLSIILLSPIPRAMPDIIALPDSRHILTNGVIQCKYSKLLRPTLIFVGVSVVKQWNMAINTFTDLKVFAVGNVMQLKEMFDLIENNKINEYDIVLVKNGNITTSIEMPFNIPLDPKNKIQQPSIYNVIANLRDFCWARVIIDDFDTIKIPSNACIIRSLFTWFVSSTTKNMANGLITYNNTYGPLTSDMLASQIYQCKNIFANSVLFTMLNIRNKTKYISDTTNVPNPKYHIATFKNPNNTYISLLASMGNDNVNRITEMLNGDAIGEAASAAGIASNSVVDIFNKILKQKYEDYRFSTALIEFIEYQVEHAPERKPLPSPDMTYGKKNLLEFEDIEYKYPSVNSLLQDTKEEYTTIKTNSGKEMQRVKDNIKHGECPVCKTDFTDEEGVFIASCCSAVYCKECGVKANRISNRANHLSGICCNCRANITLKDLVYINIGGTGVKLTDITEESFEDDKVDDEPVVESDKAPIDKNRTKYNAIVDIILGKTPVEDVRVDMHIPNMMKGIAYLPESVKRKVLIFANFEETLDEVIKILAKNNIKFWRLQGGFGEIANCTKTFTEYTDTCALVINSTKHCSGLNLQTATDLIFAHHIIDPAVESQVAGRGHRLGRTSPLNIWFMCYDNEYNTLSTTHNVRIMSKEELTEEAKLEANYKPTDINNNKTTNKVVAQSSLKLMGSKPITRGKMNNSKVKKAPPISYTVADTDLDDIELTFDDSDDDSELDD